MTYKTAIAIKEIKWAWKTRRIKSFNIQLFHYSWDVGILSSELTWKPFQITFIIPGLQWRYSIGTIRALLRPVKYKIWWDKEICRIYREQTGMGEAFAKSFDGLPKLSDKIPNQIKENRP